MLPIYLIFYGVATMQFFNMYWSMPASVPVHFNAAGEPDKWMSQAAFAQLHWVFVIMMTGIFALMALLIKKMPPKLLPLPNKDYWLAPERADRTIETLVDSLTWMGVITGGFVIIVDNGIVEATRVSARSVDLHLVSTTAIIAAGLIGLIVARLLLKFRQPPSAAVDKKTADENKAWDEKK